MLDLKYSTSENDVEYIFYTDFGCNSNYKHTVDEYTNYICDTFNENLKWYECVVLDGACVVWKKKSIIIVQSIIRRFLAYREGLKPGGYFYYLAKNRFDKNKMLKIHL